MLSITRVIPKWEEYLWVEVVCTICGYHYEDVTCGSCDLREAEAFCKQSCTNCKALQTFGSPVDITPNFYHILDKVN